jgi:hypothetical protein
MSGLGSAQQQGRSYDEGEVVEGRPRDTPQLTSSQRSVRREREANVPWEADFGATNDNQEGYAPPRMGEGGKSSREHELQTTPDPTAKHMRIVALRFCTRSDREWPLIARQIPKLSRRPCSP